MKAQAPYPYVFTVRHRRDTEASSNSIVREVAGDTLEACDKEDTERVACLLREEDEAVLEDSAVETPEAVSCPTSPLGSLSPTIAASVDRVQLDLTARTYGVSSAPVRILSFQKSVRTYMRTTACL